MSGRKLFDRSTYLRIACWIPKATNTHSQYVILIAFPLLQWLNERTSALRNTYIASCYPGHYSTDRLHFLVEARFVACELTDYLCVYILDLFDLQRANSYYITSHVLRAMITIKR